jgi:FkbM family methyltransferase
MALSKAIIYIFGGVAIFAMLFNSWYALWSWHTMNSCLPTTAATAPRTSNPSQPVRNSKSGRYSYSVPDFMQARFNRSAAMDLTFDNSIEEHKYVSMTCAERGAYPFFMSSIPGGPMEQWVCKNRGEVKVTRVMLSVLKQSCAIPDGSEHGQKGLMLDIGANLGYYGLFALRLGCETLFFDLQKGCQTRLNNALIINGFTPAGRVIPYGVNSKAASFKSPIGGCDGRFPASAREQKVFDRGEHVSHLDTLDTFVDDNQTILMVKIDTEGNEYHVLQGSMPFFQKRLIQNAIVEVTPGAGFWKSLNVTQLQVATTFETIAQAGYSMVSLEDWSVHKTPKQVFKYINEAKFVQSDMWLTLDSNVNATVMNSSVPTTAELKQSEAIIAVAPPRHTVVPPRVGPSPGLNCWREGTVTKRQKYNLLVSGCGYSGTGFISKSFVNAGYNVGHEVVASDGLVSWLAVSKYREREGTGPSHFDYRHVFTLVRHPIKVVRSWQGGYWDFLHRGVSIANESLIGAESFNKLGGKFKALEWWRTFTILAINASECSMRTEDVNAEVLKSMCIRAELPQCAEIDWEKVLTRTSTSTNAHGGKSFSLTWDVLTEEAVTEMEKEVLANARSLCKRWYDDC